MKDFRYIGYPLFIILISALLCKLIHTYVGGNLHDYLIIFIRITALFTFGMSLNKASRRSYTVWKVVFSVVVTLFLLLMELDLFYLPVLSDMIFFFGVSSFFINMMYILCGYMFVD